MRMTIQKAEPITVSAARAQLKMLLSNARTLNNFSLEMLERSYRVPRKEIEHLLTVERQRREAAGR